MTLHIENARPGHVALVARVERAAREVSAEDETRGSATHEAVAELEDARGDLLALLRAQEEALESAAEREKGRDKLFVALSLLLARIMEHDGGADLLPVHSDNDPENYAAIQLARVALQARP